MVQVVSSIVTLAALIFACGSAAHSHNDFWGLHPSSSGDAPDDSDDDRDCTSEAVFLHGTFACAACFMLMVRLSVPLRVCCNA
jgi:hypothetical protein